LDSIDLERSQLFEILEENMNTMNVSTRSIETRVVGVTYEGRQQVVALLTQWEQVFLIRESDNAFDSNAVRVQRWDHQQVGYLNRELAKILAPRMDRYGKSVKATVTTLTGGYYPGASLRVLIKFRMPE
jgi:single-stranded-DNA-specific exonuclease